MKTRRSTGRTWVTCAAIALGALVWTVPALAAPESTRHPTTRTPVPEIVVTGKHYKPRVFIFMGRPKLNLDWSVDDPRFMSSFLERTLDSVWTRPF